MGLQIWLPLNGNLNNYGASRLKFNIVGSTTTLNSNAGKVGRQCYYNNTNSSATGIVSDLPIQLGTQVSMFCWVNLDNFGASSNLTGILGQHRFSANQGMGITMKYVSATTGKLSLNTGNGSGRTYNTYTGNTILNAGTWYHVGFTYDGTNGSIKLYVNGELDGTATYANQKNVEDYIQLFGWSFNSSSGAAIYSGYNLKGYLQDVRIYDNCLSSKEVKELSKGLVLHYTFNTTTNYSSTNIPDNAGFGYSGTTYGTLVASVDSGARYKNCVKFNNGSALRTIDVIGAANEFSISVWLKPTVNQTACIWNGRTSIGKAHAIFYIGGGIRFDDDESMTQTSVNLIVNQWNHIVCTYKKSGQKCIYINGVLNKSVSAGGNTHSNNYATIGMSSSGDATPSGNQFIGYMSDYRIYKTELSAKDVANLYKDAFIVDNKQNIHCYELIEDDSMSEIDIEKNGSVIGKTYTEIITSYYDRNGYIEPDGSVWIRLFHHNNPANTSNLFATSDSFTTKVYKNENAWFNMSICNYVTKWEFLVKQKLESTSAETAWRWKQPANPMVATWDQSKLANIVKIDGYSSWADNYAGIYRYTSGTTPLSNTYLRQANATSGNWYGATGCCTTYSGGIPGFNGTIVTTGSIDIYLRIDNLEQSEQENIVKLSKLGISSHELWEI